MDVPNYGTLMAQIVCERLGIKSQNERVLLDQAKD
jgi:hypothetical protein